MGCIGGRRFARLVARDPCAEALQRTRVQLLAWVPLLRVTSPLLPCFLSHSSAVNTVNKARKRKNGVHCKAFSLKTTSLSLFTAQLRASRHVTFTPTLQLLKKEEYYASVLESQAGTLPPLPWSKCAAFSI